MNSEELERSLRTEFESHLKNVLADIRQEVSGFQEKIDAEIEKHKSLIDESFRDFSARIEANAELDEILKDSVLEHLRLARDEGARITAEAITEAEKMEAESAPAVSFNELRDAVSDISSKTTQAEILKSLVNHAAQFVPRGAFFVVKNEHFVGWRTFGKEADADDLTVREVYFPVSATTVLGESVRSLAAVESSYGTYDDDSVYLEKLEFGQPDRMYAIPLIARGRGVAVLYADYGQEGTSVNVEALETLMQVAGLTVELLAASRNGRSRTEDAHETEQAETSEPYPSEDFQQVEESREEEDAQAAESEYSEEYEATDEEFQSSSEEEEQPEEYISQPVAEVEPEEYFSQPEEESGFERQEFVSEYDFQAEPETAEEQDFSTPEYAEAETDGEAQMQEDEDSAEMTEDDSDGELKPVYEEPSWSQPVENNGYSSVYSMDEASSEETSPYESAVSESDFTIPAATEYEFETSDREFEESPSFEPVESRTEETAEAEESSEYEFSPPVMDDFSSAEPEKSFESFESQSEAKEPAYAEPVETVSQSVMSQPARTRFSERNVDLPIEVEEGERRLHNDARRFARLLVSEIKLYNEQKVSEGREAQDLYERLREAIDRSREMYDKRVQPPVAAKFDYFHYELVNALADGDQAKLGGSYPGAVV